MQVCGTWSFRPRLLTNIRRISLNGHSSAQPQVSVYWWHNLLSSSAYTDYSYRLQSTMTTNILGKLAMFVVIIKWSFRSFEPFTVVKKMRIAQVGVNTMLCVHMWCDVISRDVTWFPESADVHTAHSWARPWHHLPRASIEPSFRHVSRYL